MYTPNTRYKFNIYCTSVPSSANEPSSTFCEMNKWLFFYDFTDYIALRNILCEKKYIWFGRYNGVKRVRLLLNWSVLVLKYASTEPADLVKVLQRLLYTSCISRFIFFTLLLCKFIDFILYIYIYIYIYTTLSNFKFCAVYFMAYC